MNTYLWLKLAHILSGSLILGTGLGIAFFMLKAYLNQNTDGLRITTQNVVTADWVFTTPAIIIQFITGMWLVLKLNIPFNSIWFISTLGLFIFIGACWIPVVFIQIRIRNILNNGGSIERCRNLMKIWICLGVPAFASVLLLYFLMVSKYGIGILLFL